MNPDMTFDDLSAALHELGFTYTEEPTASNPAVIQCTASLADDDRAPRIANSYQLLGRAYLNELEAEHDRKIQQAARRAILLSVREVCG